MDEQVPRVVIGMDPHKRSVTIEVMTAGEIIVGGGRFSTDAEGYGRFTQARRSKAWQSSRRSPQPPTGSAASRSRR